MRGARPPAQSRRRTADRRRENPQLCIRDCRPCECSTRRR
nr:MAG TPA: hypothetical protein [Caudoviricetes sp.]